MYRIAFAIFILLGGTAYAAQQVVLAGTWKLEPQQCTTDLSDLPGNRLVITQTGDAVSFEYYKGEKPVSSETIEANGKSKIRWKTRLYVAYVTAHWRKGGLVMDTQWVLDNEGYQTYTVTERWQISNDRKTLYKKIMQGMIVFSREEAAAPSASSSSKSTKAPQ